MKTQQIIKELDAIMASFGGEITEVKNLGWVKESGYCKFRTPFFGECKIKYFISENEGTQYNEVSLLMANKGSIKLDSCGGIFIDGIIIRHIADMCEEANIKLAYAKIHKLDADLGHVKMSGKVNVSDYKNDSALGAYIKSNYADRFFVFSEKLIDWMGLWEW